ncbi:MAG: iron-containing alcohol dehydrogenase [Bacteroidetes bacterium]|nr:iron-containing alcohol dehydrogenase [Bacteroidota bacterium]
MNNFSFQNPVKVVFGKGTIAQLPKLIDKKNKIMLTYGGGSIFKNGVYVQVKKALSGFEIIEFGGIEPNPTYETLMKAVAIARQEEVDFLLPVGGGSVLDGTKFIAAAVPYEGNDEWNDIVLGAKRYSEALPIGAVLTLPATGSEMNYYAVISRTETQEKYGMGSPVLYPKFSILDPETTFSLPKTQIANGIADAFVHVMEQYLTFDQNTPIQDRFAEGVLSTLIEVAPKVLAENPAYEDMANYMWAATVALNGWISTGVAQDWATHAIGHEITALHGIDHARTLAVVLPHLMAYKKDRKLSKIVQYGKRVWDINADADQTAELAIEKTVAFFESLGIPSKASAYGIGEETIAEIEKRFAERNQKIGEHGDISAEDIRKILEMSIS